MSGAVPYVASSLKKMAAKYADDEESLLADQDEDGYTVVCAQPQASDARPSSNISHLSIIIKALGEEKYLASFGCKSFHVPRYVPTPSASALLIGRSRSSSESGSVSDQSLSNGCHHVISLKEHLRRLNVDVFKCETDFQGSQENLDGLISRFFSTRNISLFILYYSGPTNERGDWAITTIRYDEVVDEYIRLDMIADKWKGWANRSSHLLIIIDADNASKWVEKVKNHESNSNIYVMASPKCDESATTLRKEGLYTESLLGMHKNEYYPVSAQEKINAYLNPLDSFNSCLCKGFFTF